MPKMVRKRSFDRTVVKKCPKCDQQVPVACKYCPCGHQFSKRHSSLPGLDDPSYTPDDEQNVVKIRRTERTRRERPDYFNPMMIEDQQKRARKKSQNSTPVEPPPPAETPSSKRGRGRGRPKGTPNKPSPVTTEPEEKDIKPPVVEENSSFNLTSDKIVQFNIILSELNRKMCSQTFNPS